MREILLLIIVATVSASYIEKRYTLYPQQSFPLQCGSCSWVYFNITSDSLPLEYHFSTNDGKEHLSCQPGVQCFQTFVGTTSNGAPPTSTFYITNPNNVSVGLGVVWGPNHGLTGEIIGTTVVGALITLLFVVASYYQMKCMRRVNARFFKNYHYLLFFAVVCVSGEELANGTTSFVCSSTRGYDISVKVTEGNATITSYPVDVCGNKTECHISKGLWDFIIHPFQDPEDVMMTVNISSANTKTKRVWKCHNWQRVAYLLDFCLISFLLLFGFLFFTTIFQIFSLNVWEKLFQKEEKETLVAEETNL